MDANNRFIYKTVSGKLVKYVLKHYMDIPLFGAVNLKGNKLSFYSFVYGTEQYKISSLRLFTEDLTQEQINDIFSYDSYTENGFSLDPKTLNTLTQEDIKKILKDYLNKLGINLKEEIETNENNEIEEKLNENEIYPVLEKIKLDLLENKIPKELKSLEQATKEILLKEDSNLINNFRLLKEAKKEYSENINKEFQEKFNFKFKALAIAKNSLGNLFNSPSLKKDYKSYKKELWLKGLKDFSIENTIGYLKEISRMTEELKMFFYNIDLIYGVLNNKSPIFKEFHKGIEFEDIGLENLDGYKISRINGFLNNSFDSSKIAEESRDKIGEVAYQGSRGKGSKEDDIYDEIHAKESEIFFDKNKYLLMGFDIEGLDKIQLKDFVTLLSDLNKLPLDGNSLNGNELLINKLQSLVNSIPYFYEILKTFTDVIKEDKTYRNLFLEKNDIALQENLLNSKAKYEQIKDLNSEEASFKRDLDRIKEDLKRTNFLFILSKYNYNIVNRQEVSQTLLEQKKELMEKLNDIYSLQQKIKMTMNNGTLEGLKKKDLDTIELTMTNF